MSLLLGPLGLVPVASTDIVLNYPQNRVVTPVVEPRGTDYESAGPVVPVGPDITLELLGAGITSAYGSFTPEFALGLQGISFSATPGSFTPAMDLALLGQVATASPGSVGVGISPALGGSAITSGYGALTPEFSIALTGGVITGGYGILTPSGSGPDVTVVLSGLSMTGAFGTMTPGLTPVMLGISATAGAGTLLAGASSSLLGQSITVTAGTLYRIVPGSGKSSRVVLPQKDSQESVNIQFDFTSSLGVGETVGAAVVTSTIYSGTDPAAASMIYGAASVGQRSVWQLISDGVPGCTYLLQCTAVTSTPNSYTISAYLAVP